MPQKTEAHGRRAIRIADDVGRISTRQLERTLRSNVFSCFHMTKAALPYLRKGSAIINTPFLTAYRGSPHLVDYAATKAPSSRSPGRSRRASPSGASA